MIRAYTTMIGPIWMGIAFGRYTVAVGITCYPAKRQLAAYLTWRGPLPLFNVLIN